jgi:acetoin utilization deacetylase AcuC-like enzyme
MQRAIVEQKANPGTPAANRGASQTPSLVLISSEQFAEHQTPPGHPERSARAEVMDVVAARWRGRNGDVVAPREATHEHLARVHTTEYLRRIEATSGRAVALDVDTYTSPESYEIARLAAGAAVDAVDRALGASQSSALALVRPPGHHAGRDRAMGFCLFNNVAVAAAHARASGAGRVAIVDYDVHHGNGTQEIFDADPRVMYVSLHQYPYYPGTGAATEVGEGIAKGTTVNLPLEAGAGDADYRLAFTGVVVPILRQFRPDLLLVSAGFDAHERDPLGGMRLSVPAFAAMTMELRAVAEECCEGRMVLVVEGGYDLRAFAASIQGVVDALASPVCVPEWPEADGSDARGRVVTDVLKKVLSPYWRL